MSGFYAGLLEKGIDGAIGYNPDIEDGKFANLAHKYPGHGAPPIEVNVLRYKHVTELYGGPHCTTQVLLRE